MTFEFREHQIECIDAIRAAARKGVRKQLICLPTGAGKGEIMVRLPSELDRWPALILVNGTSLIDQIAMYARRAHPDKTVGVERAESESPVDADIVVASVSTVGRKDGKSPSRRGKWGSDHFKIISVDEVHHLPATTYMRAVRHFGGVLKDSDGPLIVGWTATPWRTDKKDLAEYLDEVVFERTLMWAQETGVLCPHHAERIQSTADLRDIHVRASGEFDPQDLAAVLNTDWVNSEIISGIEQHAFSGDKHTPRKHVIVFCHDQGQVRALTHQLNERGHPAAEVIDSTPPYERTERIAKFKAGELRLLLTCAALVEGFDAPMTDCVVMAKPMRSSLPYVQATGRGLRVHPGKNYLLVLDTVGVCGKFRQLTATDVFGVADIDCQGGSVLDAAKLAMHAAELGLTVEDGDSVDDLERRLKLAERIAQKTVRIETTSEAVDLFVASQPSADVDEHSQFPWVKVSAHRYVIRIQKAVWSLAENPKGDWWIHMGGRKEYCAPAGSKNPLRYADRLIRGRVDGWRQMKRNAGWKRDPITWPQVERLQQLGWDILPPGITRGSASHLIDTIALNKRLAKAIPPPTA